MPFLYFASPQIYSLRLDRSPEWLLTIETDVQKNVVVGRLLIWPQRFHHLSWLLMF